MTSSVFPFDFVCVRIPEDASAECEEVTFTATKPGDLTDIVKRCFAGGTVTNVEPKREGKMETKVRGGGFWHTDQDLIELADRKQGAGAKARGGDSGAL